MALADGYELERNRRLGLVDRMVEFAIRAARDEAVFHEVGPDTASPADDGFPIAWAISWLDEPQAVPRAAAGGRGI